MNEVQIDEKNAEAGIQSLKVEFAAMKRLAAVLELLDVVTRKRVLEWGIAKFARDS